MLYTSTRGMSRPVTAGQAILQGLADDGGLYVPESFPSISKPLAALMALSYQDLAYEILAPYLTDFTESELRACVTKAYGDNFDDPLIAPLREADGLYFLELFHGRTLAFKDMALSILPHLLRTAAVQTKNNKKIIILTATSGDTGKAALDAFADAEGVSIAVYYPENGVSPMQKRQMVTQEGDNTFVFGVRGNFDDTQTGVKRIFSDPALAERMAAAGLMLSSANSINIGRLLPQVVYYFYAYKQLCEKGAAKIGDPVNFSVPTGNFGDILAGYYAKQMGLPVGRLICASNENNVLYDFFMTHEYNKNRKFFLTISPSMDILISSNFERLLLHATREPDQVKSLMGMLSAEGRFFLDVDMSDFYGAYATEAETRAMIHDMAHKGYIIDPHTAVACHAGKRYAAVTGDNTPQVVISTASPFKFAQDVYAAILDPREPAQKSPDDLRSIEQLAEWGKLTIPAPLRDLAHKPTKHKTVCEVAEMQALAEQIVIFP